MVMTRAQFARDLQDGINAHFGMSYDEHKPEYSKLFKKRTSKRAYEEMVLRVGLGEAVEKPEGGMITFDAGGEGYITRVDFYTYSLAFSITEEAIDDNLYADLSEVYGKELGKSLQHAKEVRGANIINNATNASFTGGDLQPLASTVHPLWGGGNYSNTFTTSSDISEEALEDACIQVGGYVNDRGRPIVVRIKQAVIPRQQEFQLERILTATKRVGTNLNDPNVLKEGGYIPDGYHVNHYLIDPDSWGLQTDVDLGLTFWQRKGVKKGMETDFRTGNLMYKVSERIGFSWGDPRCFFYSSGSPV
jgi:hypothetical protein